jgi:vacuolar-type H+-ATPase subunit C/Vma6
MTTYLDDVIARVHGLGTHLLSSMQLHYLAGARDLADLGHRLEAAGLRTGGGTGSAEALEQSIRRIAGQRLLLLARWCGARTGSLRIVFEDEDRRSVRALLRGLVNGAPPDLRQAGLIPTPELPLRAIEELALQHSPGQFAALLVAWGNAYGSAMLESVAGPQSELLTAELAIARVWGERVREGARHGDLVLREFVAESHDIENMVTAMLLAGSDFDRDLMTGFLPGGDRVNQHLFSKAAAAPDASAATAILAAGLGDCPLGHRLSEHLDDPTTLESVFLSHQIGWLQQRSRHDPLTSAPVLGYALRVRREVVALQQIIWGLTLGAPADLLELSRA